MDKRRTTGVEASSLGDDRVKCKCLEVGQNGSSSVLVRTGTVREACISMPEQRISRMAAQVVCGGHG